MPMKDILEVIKLDVLLVFKLIFAMLTLLFSLSIVVRACYGNEILLIPMIIWTVSVVGLLYTFGVFG